ncbi:MAG: glycosyltransferase family 4 protein [Sedimentisphaerales bacterium]|nr:glycosyltransferase family 4 protein [Sedimentisphaerales bacterium]
MHIAYIHQYFTTRFGSSGTRSYEFARRWVQAGHHVTVITSTAQLQQEELSQTKNIKRGLKRLYVEGIEILALEIPYHQSMAYSKRAWSFLRFLTKSTFILAQLKNVDVVYATSTPLTVAVPALSNKFCRRIPFVLEVRDLWPKAPIARGIIKNKLAIKLALWFERTIYLKAAGIVALSIDMKDYIDKITKEPAKTIVVTNCSDIDLFKPLKGQEKQKVRAELGWENKFVVVHAGAVGQVNGLYRIVEAANRIKSYNEICFVFIGDGNQRPYLEEMVKGLKLDNVKFMDPVPKTELARILPAADIGLVSINKMLHTQYNSANKLFDYFACGLPILLNYAGWQKDVLDRYSAGLSCDNFNDEEFVEHLLRLLKNPDLRKEMGRNSRRLAEDEYNRDVLSKKVLDFAINRVLGKRQKNV